MKSKLQNVLCLTEDRKKYAVVVDDIVVVVVVAELSCNKCMIMCMQKGTYLNGQIVR